MPSFELSKQIYLALDATDRSHQSSDRARKAGHMKLAKRTFSVLAVAAAILTLIEANFGRSVQARTLVQDSAPQASDTP